MKWVLLLALSLLIVASSQQCRTSYYVSGRYLKGHVIVTQITKDFGHCLIVCSEEQSCQSTNFHARTLTCELNNVNRHAHPQDYEFKNGYTYSDYVSKVIFKQHMTPLWLKAHASYIYSHHSITNQQITFERGGNLSHVALLKVPLVATGLLSDNTPLTIEIVVAIDVSIPRSTDSDPFYGLSDEVNFVGFKTPDKKNNRNMSLCFGVEGFSGANLTVNKRYAPTEGASDSSPPDRFVFTFKLTQDKPWGMCFIAHDRGLTTEVQYNKRRLTPNRGLTLEVYKTDAREKVGIKYIQAIVNNGG